MEPKDYIVLAAGIVSLGALAVAILALIRTSRHNEVIRRYASAGPETSVLAQINQSRLRVAEVNQKLLDITRGRTPSNLNADEKRHIGGLETIYHEAVEVLLNTYELACGMYRDGKLDRERFRRQYFEEIKKLYDGGSQAYKDRLHSPSTPYRAIQAVYEEWFNLER
jgi:hypothetical protein